MFMPTSSNATAPDSSSASTGVLKEAARRKLRKIIDAFFIFVYSFLLFCFGFNVYYVLKIDNPHINNYIALRQKSVYRMSGENPERIHATELEGQYDLISFSRSCTLWKVRHGIEYVLRRVKTNESGS